MLNQNHYLRKFINLNVFVFKQKKLKKKQERYERRHEHTIKNK